MKLNSAFTRLLCLLCTFQVLAEPEINKVQDVHFGSVNLSEASKCRLTRLNGVRQDCSDINGDVSVGQLVITNIDKKATYRISVSGSTNGAIYFNPKVRIKGAKGGAFILRDGESNVVTSKNSGLDFTVEVYGDLEIANSGSTAGLIKLDYNITIEPEFGI
jgi:hypothetical protein